MDDLTLISAAAAEKLHAESQQMDVAWLNGGFAEWMESKRKQVFDDARAEHDAARAVIGGSELA